MSKAVIRATAIKAGRLSMLHMRHALTVQRHDTPAMRWGRLVHMAVLQPIELLRLPRWEGYEDRNGDQCYAKRGDAWAQFCASLGNRDYISADEIEPLERITDAASKALDRLPRIVDAEVKIEWTDRLYGAAVCRVDALLAGGAWLEVKTTGNIEKRAFMSQCERLGYPLQMGWYAHGLAQRADGGQVGPCWLLAIESDQPHATAIYSVPDPILRAGYEEAEAIARHYRACEAAGVWPGPYDDGAGDYERPGWAVGGDEWSMDEKGGDA